MKCMSGGAPNDCCLQVLLPLLLCAVAGGLQKRQLAPAVLATAGSVWFEAAAPGSCWVLWVREHCTEVPILVVTPIAKPALSTGHITVHGLTRVGTNCQQAHASIVKVLAHRPALEGTIACCTADWALGSTCCGCMASGPSLCGFCSWSHTCQHEGVRSAGRLSASCCWLAGSRCLSPLSGRLRAGQGY
jgi:hypothetical protein